MNKARKRFILYAMLAVFVLLTSLLAVINVINFTMAAEDADKILNMLKNERGRFTPEPPSDIAAGDESFRRGMGPMGPDSPEMRNSTMYFTFRFDKDESVETVMFRISAMSEDEAKALAGSIVQSGKKSGWVNTIYRFSVYGDGKYTYVTAIDQARELYPSYRILTFSVIGGVLGLIVSFLFLALVGKRLFSPLEEADRKQKRFLREAENEFKVPLTIIEAGTEIIEKDSGPSEQTSIIRRQIGKMTSTIEKIGALSFFDGDKTNAATVDLSAILTAEITAKKQLFDERGITVLQNVEDGVTVVGDPATLGRAIAEIVENAVAFSEEFAKFVLTKENGRVTMKASNKTQLKNGNVDIVFDRFATLENSEGKGRHGLGLSYVKDAIRAAGGRVRADVVGGVFTLKITL